MPAYRSTMTSIKRCRRQGQGGMSPQADCFKSSANEAHLASGKPILPRIARVAAIGLPRADNATVSEYALPSAANNTSTVGTDTCQEDMRRLYPTMCARAVSAKTPGYSA